MLSRGLVFRQLVEKASSTYTYIVGCAATRKAVIIDPVLETAERDAKFLRELDLTPVYGLNTHVHADHITGTTALKKFFPSLQSVLYSGSGGKADKLVEHGEKIRVGEKEIEVRSTPGHTDGCVTYVLHSDRVAFTGDALLIRACGRTDFQQGSAEHLYESVWREILSLPEDYTLCVGHNYDGVLMSSVREEKLYNPRLTKTKEEFVELMHNLNLQYPKQIDRALPANLVDGAGAQPAN